MLLQKPGRAMPDSRLTLAEPVLQEAAPRSFGSVRTRLSLLVALSLAALLSWRTCGGREGEEAAFQEPIALRQVPLFGQLLKAPRALSKARWFRKPGQYHILCTGGTGYIGSHTVIKLIESGFKVSILDNLRNSNLKVMERLKDITGAKIPFFKVDLSDAAAVDKLFAENQFDGVIHFAGLKAVGESVAKPLLYYENNIVGTLNLLKAMHAHGCNALVFSSSATVYKPCEQLIDEEKPLGCSNPYGWSKFMIERILMDATVADKNLKVSILRYFNPVGAHPSGKIGDSPSGWPNNLMPFIQQVAVGRRNELSVFGKDYSTPDGTGVRDYIHIDDLAEGHVCAMNKILGMTSGYIVHNLGSGKGNSVLEMVKAFEEASGKPIPCQICDRRPGDLATVVANPAKAKADFGWEVKRTLQDQCESAWKWQSENPYGYDDAPVRGSS